MSQPSTVAFPGQPSEPAEPRPLGQNLPVQPTPLIGRRDETEAASRLLRRPDVRVLTLTGPPGIGKTRLGIEVSSRLAKDFADGTYLIPLAPIAEPALVLPAVTQILGIREVPGQPLSESLAQYLRSRQILLLLDNFEQVIGAAAEIAELLGHCPDLKVLVTSRERLHIYGEHDYPVPPLSVPPVSDQDNLPDLEALSGYEAVTLFMQRAQAVSPDFTLTERNAPAVAEICLRLDGIPLAIELAAARIVVLPPEELLARLKSRLKVLTGGARNLPERQQSLQATIDWSYNLLDRVEQARFRRLGVFVGGCTLEAIEQVCGSEPGRESLDEVGSLVAKSLLQRQDEVVGEPRFVMLETIREYARQKLAEADSSKAGEFDATGERHCDYFLQLAEAAEHGALGNEQAKWMRRLDIEQNNLRAALEWALAREDRAGGPGEGGGGMEKGLRLAGALMHYWDNRGYFSEGRQWCAAVLSKTQSTEPSIERARALRTLARMIWQQGDFTEARSIYEASLEISRALDDDPGVVAALHGLGNVALWRGEYDLGLSLYRECLALGRRLGDRMIISRALCQIGTDLMWKGEYRAAQLPLAEALSIEREIGHSAGIANTVLTQGVVAYELGDEEQAKALLNESLTIARDIGLESIIAACLAQLGRIALCHGDPQYAESFLLEGLSRARVSGTRRWSRWYLVGLAELARLRGMAARAATLIGASEGILSADGAHYNLGMSAEIDRIITGISAELDEETFARVRAEGRAMSVEEVTGYAVGPSPDVPGETELSHGHDASAGTSGDSEGAGTPGDRVAAAYPDHLTEREVEVLRFIAAGKSNQEIASELVLSLRTVERHISNIYQKIGATGKVARALAATYALTHDLTHRVRADRQTE